MAYETLYRKYRSNDLSELVGQSHIIQTLTNAIQHDRLSHAYIFSGPRGTGKTSTARILAKLINQTTSDISECPLCQKITAGSCIDVIEIDAASHTGVDHMRQLTEQVQFLPVEAKNKVFIIDEVHMLSTGAFNALLKTLEEPPQNVIFILATTELNKIPATIQSRAQTLHFRLLDNDQIATHLSEICDKEGYSIEPQALSKLVQVANGGMRDALSLLDQLMSICDQQSIKVNDISSLLGTLDASKLHEFLSLCCNKDIAAVSQLMGYIDQGIDIFQFYEDIIAHLHRVLLIENNHSFSVSDHIVSSWMQWFCDQIGQLKTQSTPGIVAQVSLHSRLVSTPNRSMINETSFSEPQGSPADHSNPPKPTNVQPSDQKAHYLPPEPQHTPSDSTQKFDSQTSVTSSPQPVPEPSKHKVSDNVLHEMSKEYPVLSPVLKGAKIIAKHQTLYLILEETYQFFEKKLAEEKFKSRFLDVYNQRSNSSMIHWVVSSDINTVHQSMEKDVQNDEKKADHSTNQSKTINQIIEMFEGQVIK